MCRGPDGPARRRLRLRLRAGDPESHFGGEFFFDGEKSAANYFTMAEKWKIGGNLFSQLRICRKYFTTAEFYFFIIRLILPPSFFYNGGIFINFIFYKNPYSLSVVKIISTQ